MQKTFRNLSCCTGPGPWRERVVLFPDEGKGYEVWRSKIGVIAAEVGFAYSVSRFMEGRERGADIADLIGNEK